MESDSLPPSVALFQVIGFLLLQAQSSNIYILPIVLVIVILLIMSALISGSEVAFFSISPSQLEELKESELDSDKKVLNLLDRPRMLLASILISNNFVNISIIILFNYLMTLLMPNTDLNIIALVNALALTPILVFFGEVSPKVFATKNNLFVARFTSKLFLFLRFITYPFSFLLVKSGLLIEKRFEGQNHEIDLEEIEKAIDLSTNDGTTKEDVNILKGIVHFGNTTVKQIMTPRVDVLAVKSTLTFTEVMNKVKEAGYSRMPVYEDTIDKIEGILYLKDLLEHINKDDSYNWLELIREPFFVPETKKIDDLLREIQTNRKHQAIVVDEYGGTKGLVTLEDILEEVLGEIKDEFDEELKASFKKINDNIYLLDGKINVVDLCDILGVAEEEFDEVKGESGTLAGIILELSGELPKKGAVLKYNKYAFNVLSMERNRINKVKLIIENV